ncbi:hypothetical protein ACQ7A6_28770, partial [Klebsiella pneumoniae]
QNMLVQCLDYRQPIYFYFYQSYVYHKNRPYFFRVKVWLIVVVMRNPEFAESLAYQGWDEIS